MFSMQVTFWKERKNGPKQEKVFAFFQLRICNLVVFYVRNMGYLFNLPFEPTKNNKK